MSSSQALDALNTLSQLSTNLPEQTVPDDTRTSEQTWITRQSAGHPLTTLEQTALIGEDQIETRIILTSYSNLKMIIISQTEKMGHVVLYEESGRTLLGGFDPYKEALASSLVDQFQQPILLSCCLKPKQQDARAFQDILECIARMHSK